MHCGSTVATRLYQDRLKARRDQVHKASNYHIWHPGCVYACALRMLRQDFAETAEASKVRKA